VKHRSAVGGHYVAHWKAVPNDSQVSTTSAKKQDALVGTRPDTGTTLKDKIKARFFC
jgi:hypothetical protein